MQTTTIAIYTEESHLQANAHALAERLHLPIANRADQAQYDYLLLLTPEYIGLQKTGEKSLPLHIDFLSGELTYRRQHASLRRETLARALGLKSKNKPRIVDATAGLGRDSFILACLGFEVELLERSPIIHTLLDDAIKRADADPKIRAIVKRLHLQQSDAITWLTQKIQMQDRPNIIYLDPMFPERTKSALAKKSMRIFHDIVGEDLDADKVLELALSCATDRVVVKRPRLAAYLGGHTPAFALEGSSSRFDIYLIQAAHGTDTTSV